MISATLKTSIPNLNKIHYFSRVQKFKESLHSKVEGISKIENPFYSMAGVDFVFVVQPVRMGDLNVVGNVVRSTLFRLLPPFNQYVCLVVLVLCLHSRVSVSAIVCVCSCSPLLPLWWASSTALRSDMADIHRI